MSDPAAILIYEADMVPNQQKHNQAKGIIPAATIGEAALDTAAAVSSMIPVLGGPVSSVLTGLAQDQRFGRVNEFLWGLNEAIRDLSAASEAYVKSEEFRAVLEETLRRVYWEKSGEKRRMFRKFLVGAIQNPGASYDEQLDLLRILEEIQLDYILVLRAFRAKRPWWSLGHEPASLTRSLPNMSQEHLESILKHLVRLGLVSASYSSVGVSLWPMRLTKEGERFLRFIEKG